MLIPAYPVIEVRLSKSEETLALKKALDKLERENATLRIQYAHECELNMKLMDVLKEHGIPRGSYCG